MFSWIDTKTQSLVWCFDDWTSLQNLLQVLRPGDCEGHGQPVSYGQIFRQVIGRKKSRKSHKKYSIFFTLTFFCPSCYFIFFQLSVLFFTVCPLFTSLPEAGDTEGFPGTFYSHTDILLLLHFIFHLGNILNPTSLSVRLGYFHGRVPALPCRRSK